jgi:glycosyltransferase involved in cell wall biosynthesis
MKKMVSVIMPVYNGEKFLNRSIDSVLSQEGVNRGVIELLLINDGSTDKSIEIMNDYQKKYPETIKTVSRNNKGAAYTRNQGVDIAKGEYMTFLDQDDYLDNDFIATLYERINGNAYDVVQSGYRAVTRHGEVKKQSYPERKPFGKYLAIPAWAKIYRTKFLRENHIRFFENNIGEDSVFTLKCILRARYGTVSYIGYNNSYDNNTNVTNTLHKGLSPSVKFLALLDEMYSIQSDDNTKQAYMTYNLVRTCYYYLLSYGRYATVERFISVYGDIFIWLRSKKINPIGVRYVWFPPDGERLVTRIGMPVFTIIHTLRGVRLFAKIYAKGIR